MNKVGTFWTIARSPKATVTQKQDYAYSWYCFVTVLGANTSLLILDLIVEAAIYIWDLTT